MENITQINECASLLNLQLGAYVKDKKEIPLANDVLKVKIYKKFDQNFNSKRYANLITLRGVAMHILYFKYKMTLSAVGSLFEKDHSTVLHSIRKVNDMISLNDFLYQQAYNEMNDYLHD